MLENVLDMMSQLSDLYDEIYKASQKKQRGIIENKVEDVSEAVKREWELLADIASLEEKRAQAVSQALGLEYKAGENVGTVSDLMKIASPSEQEALRQAADKLREQVAAQQDLNAQIQSLVDLHLEYTNYMVNMVFAEPQVSSIYGTSGYVSDGPAESGALHGIIDSQA